MTVVARIYHPTHRKQTLEFQGKLIGCTDTSFAMLVDAQSLGGIKVTELTVRNLSNERFPDPNSPGLNMQQLRDVAVKLHVTFIDRKGFSKGQAKADLDNERRMVAQVWYPDIGGNAIGHALHVQCRRLNAGHWQWLCNDPLKTSSQWIGEDAMLDAMRSFASRTGLATGLRFGISRPVPRIAKGY